MKGKKIRDCSDKKKESIAFNRMAFCIFLCLRRTGICKQSFNSLKVIEEWEEVFMAYYEVFTILFPKEKYYRKYLKPN